MALETLKGVKEIGGFDVIHHNARVYHAPAPEHFVYVDHNLNSIAFKIQDGPVKENGVNGCQVDTLIHAAREIILGLNKNFPCEENTCAIECLTCAIYWLNERKKDRESRNVEGYNKD